MKIILEFSFALYVSLLEEIPDGNCFKNDSGHPVLIYDFNGISPIVPNIQIILEMF